MLVVFLALALIFNAIQLNNLRELHTEKDELEETLADYEVKFDFISEEIKKLNTSVKDRDKIIDEKETKIEEVSKELNDKNIEIEGLLDNNKTLSKKVKDLDSKIKSITASPNRGTSTIAKTERTPVSTTSTGAVYKITAYDLTVESCGKSPSHSGYGITASGYSLKGHSHSSAMAIAVDPKVIPLGSKVRLTFKDSNYSKYNGVYTARDTGGAIKGKKIDVFLGEGVSPKVVSNFGRTEAHAEIVK